MTQLIVALLNDQLLAAAAGALHHRNEVYAFTQPFIQGYLATTGLAQVLYIYHPVVGK